MPRAATTTDVFNAIAEPRRREIIDVLARGRRYAVGQPVAQLQIAQLAASKHLAVPRKAGIVSVSKPRSAPGVSTQPYRSSSPCTSGQRVLRSSGPISLTGLAERAEQTMRETT